MRALSIGDKVVVGLWCLENLPNHPIKYCGAERLADFIGHGFGISIETKEVLEFSDSSDGKLMLAKPPRKGLALRPQGRERSREIFPDLRTE